MATAMTEGQSSYQRFVATQRQSQNEDDQNRQVVKSAMQLLEQHPHFHGRSQLIEIRFECNCLRLSGTLPSFYLKQLAQEALRSLGEFEIENCIAVSGMIGGMFNDDEQPFAIVARTDSFRRIPK